MKCFLLLLATSVSLSACQPGAGEREAAPVAGAHDVETAPRPEPAGHERLIRPDGIGEARAGMTIGALRGSLPPGTTLGPAAPFMVDVMGAPVVRGGDTLYHVLVVAGEPAGDDAPITMLATSNPSFRTAEGVGPGTSLADASAVYGAATLSYSTSDESREYASFAGYPQPGIRFRVSAGDSGPAGVYRTEEEYNETSEYDPAARISLVIVDLHRRPEE